MSDQLIPLLEQIARLQPTLGKPAKRQPTFAKITNADLRETLEIVTPATRMVEIFDSWAARYQFEGASFAVIRRGRIAATSSFGSDSAFRMNEFASCSKLITGLCITQLVRKGQLEFDRTLEDIFGSIFRISSGDLDNIVRLRDPTILDTVAFPAVPKSRVKAGRRLFEFTALHAAKTTRGGPNVTTRGGPIRVPRLIYFPDWFRSLTVKDLLTHTSGMTGDIGEHNPYELTLDDRFARIVTLIKHDSSKPYLYENNNYVILGKIIEHITGKSFTDACREHVFSPLSIESFDSDNRGPYAGCFLSTANYAKLLAYLDRDLSLLGDIEIEKWPKGRADGGHSIGTCLGIRSDGNYHAEHGGDWDWGDSTRSMSVGSHHYYWSDVRTGYFYRHYPRNNSPFGDLHPALEAAAHDAGDPWPWFMDLLTNLQRVAAS